MRGKMKKIIEFLRESYGELKKVNWPSQEDVISQTVIVVISLIFISVSLALMDFAAFRLIEKIITLGK